MPADPDLKRRTSIGAHRSPESQEAILQAATDILLEGGLGSFSIDAVARRAKAGKPTIYRWWPSKVALLLDVYHRQRDMGRLPDTGHIESDLLEMLEGVLAYWRGGAGALFRSVLAQTDPEAAALLASYVDDRRKQGAEMFRRAQARGEVAAWVDPDLAVEAVSSFAWNRLLTGRLEPKPGELSQLVRQIVQGIKA